MRKSNYEAAPKEPPPRFTICRDRETNKIIVAYKVGPYFHAAEFYRKGSYNYYAKGGWGYWDSKDYNLIKKWESSPFHKDFEQIVAETEEEAINEYKRRSQTN